MPEEKPSVASVFCAAIEIESAEERREYVVKACGQDAEFFRQVDRLLQAHYGAGSFLESPAEGFGTSPTIDQPITERPGTQIGPYKLLQQIGEGGMGVVYMAEQTEPVRRRVALKVIKPGMDTKEVIARFEAERQALALMDHPNIAKVLDAGATESGRPYFVMELVKGVPVIEYCDKNHLAARDRLMLFIDICHAIQHAHQKGVIHRDLKPSNIMVTLHDGKPVPKVIDFGVSKALSQQLTEKTLFTAYGQMVGTPAYMSPEQAEMSGLDIDTRSDVYSLGVLLYELLTGGTPFDSKRLREAGYAEMQRIIREEEPPKPSTRLTTLGEESTVVSRNRGTDSRKLGQIVRGDLDWIVMKALDKERNRRYETANGFAADVERFLADQPVLASPPSVLYRSRKFARRHRPLLAAVAASIVFVSVTGVITRNWLAERSNRETTATELASVRDLRDDDLEALQQEEWLRREALPEIEQLITRQEFEDAFPVAERAWQLFPNDSRTQELWNEVSSRWTIFTTPPGASVYRKPYWTHDEVWTLVGTTPIDEAVVPRGFSCWKLVLENHEEVVGVAGPGDLDLQRNLDPRGSIPESMVRVTGSTSTGEFLIDRFEVTNAEFQAFVDAGGYEQPEVWSEPFVKGGTALTWVEAMEEFQDSTGQPGPATWSDGTFPPGQGKFPVGGICWYEAAAYANFVGKSLPTTEHWWVARGPIYPQADVSNFSGDGPAPVGSYPGVGPAGAFDMAGKVKEWCFNSGPGGSRFLLGAAWSDPPYAAGAWNAEPPFDRSNHNGLRCVQYFSVPGERLTSPLSLATQSYADMTPLSDEEFRIARRSFDYDAIPLDVAVSEIESNERWSQQLVTFRAAYDGEQVQAHLFLPATGGPPYQTVVFYPGSYAYYPSKFVRHPFSVELTDAIVLSGRILVWPIYKGTFEGEGPRLGPQPGHAWRDRFVKQVQDLRRTIDYLEQRDDMANDSIAFLGMSWGGCLGPVILAVEDRIDAAILGHGGLWPFRPFVAEVDPFNYASRVDMPVLMINGRYDSMFLPQSCQIPLYELLPAADKTYRVFNSGHVVPAAIQCQEVIAWLDRRFGAPHDTRSQPQDFDIRRQAARATSLHSIGMVHMDVGEIPSAIDSFHEANELFEALLINDPANTRHYQDELTLLHATLAIAQRTQSVPEATEQEPVGTTEDN